METVADLEKKRDEALALAQKIKRVLQEAKASGASQARIDEIDGDLTRVLVSAGEFQRAANALEQTKAATAVDSPVEPANAAPTPTGEAAEALPANESSKIDNAEKQDVEPEAQSVSIKSDDDKGTTSVASTNTVKSAEQIETPAPAINPLHSYATSTYGITLSVLSKECHKELINGKTTGSWTPTYSLISSGSGDHTNRHPAFHDDFYFDNLRMTTMIGTSANSRGTNAIQISFTIIEPYGMTLIDRIIDVAADPKVKSKNYLQQPYLLEINFYGSTELGEMHTRIPELQKRIPIKIIEMKIKVGSKGTEYSVSAVPYNHGALMESTNSTPANFEVRAKSVGDFFDSIDADQLVQQVTEKNDQREDFKKITDQINEAEASGAMDRVNELSKQYNELKKTINTPYSVTSYAGAWNAWQQKAADGKHVKIPNQIRFEFDKEIKDSLIVDPDKMPYSRSDMPPPSEKTNKAAAQDNNTTVSKKTPSNSFDPKTMLFNISSGSSVTDVINLVMRNSDYIKKQVIDPLTDKNTLPENKEVDFYKIIPKVELMDFDDKRNDYAKLTTFYVKKYSYYNTKHPSMSIAKPKGAVKRYDYIYTGKNIDIIDLSLDFDTAYYTTVIVNREKTEAVSSAVGASEGDAEADESKKAPAGAGSATPSVRIPVGNDATASSTGADTAKAVLVANAMKSVMSSSRGDMLNIKLKILGDPHFIKQDDVYANPGQGDYADNKTMINAGTLNMDRGEIFCIVNFKTPVDMDDKTGLIRNDSKYSSSKFSGYYRILSVDNEFSRGQFVQTLDCIRVFDPPADKVDANRVEKAAEEKAAESDNRFSDQPAAWSDSNEAWSSPPAEAETSGSTAEEEHTSPPVKANEDSASAEADSASAEGQGIAASLEGAAEVEATGFNAADISSPQPQNPTASSSAKQSADEAEVQAEVKKAQFDLNTATRRLSVATEDPVTFNLSLAQSRYDAAKAALDAAYAKATALSAKNAQ